MKNFFCKKNDPLGDCLKRAKERSRLLLHGNCLLERVVNDWNALPESLVLAASMNAFKARLDSFWRNYSSTYNPECLQILGMPSHIDDENPYIGPKRSLERKGKESIM